MLPEVSSISDKCKYLKVKEQGRMQPQKMDAQKGLNIFISYFINQPEAALHVHDLTAVQTNVLFKVIKLVNSDLME